MEMTDMLETHMGLIKYHAAREWKDSRLSYDDVKGLGYSTFMECWDKWDGERPFGKFFGTLLTYNIKAARLHSHFTVSVSTMQRHHIHECVEGDATLSSRPGCESTLTYLDTVADSRVVFRDSRAIRRAVSALSGRRKAIVCLMLKDNTQAEVARELGISREAVRQQYDKAIQIMRGELWLSDTVGG